MSIRNDPARIARQQTQKMIERLLKEAIGMNRLSAGLARLASKISQAQLARWEQAPPDQPPVILPDIEHVTDGPGPFATPPDPTHRRRPPAPPTDLAEAPR